VSERGGGALGPFLLGVAVGAALGALFAPNTGEVTRGRLQKRLRGLRDLAEEKAEEITALVASDEGDEDEESEAPADRRSARDELEERLAEARRRRRSAKRASDPEQEDEPVA
jgi:gas vesicle protein